MSDVVFQSFATRWHWFRSMENSIKSGYYAAETKDWQPACNRKQFFPDQM